LHATLRNIHRIDLVGFGYENLAIVHLCLLVYNPRAPAADQPTAICQLQAQTEDEISP